MTAPDFGKKIAALRPPHARNQRMLAGVSFPGTRHDGNEGRAEANASGRRRGPLSHRGKVCSHWRHIRVSEPSQCGKCHKIALDGSPIENISMLLDKLCDVALA
jgi:hypothetical protein